MGNETCAQAKERSAKDYLDENSKMIKEVKAIIERHLDLLSGGYENVCDTEKEQPRNILQELNQQNEDLRDILRTLNIIQDKLI